MKAEINCSKCNSKDINILKGDRYKIYSADFIVIICNNSKKVYGFNDVGYKSNCSKDL